MIIRRYCAGLLILLLTSLSSAQDVVVDVEPLSIEVSESSCSGQFVTHTLDHITTTPGGDEIRQFEANGSGVAINDLDNDGDLDIVLANHGGMNSILWNEGYLNFEVERLPHGDSRSVTVVDVDGDGWQDIFFTRTVTGPTYWHNLGGGQFEQLFLPNIAEPLYSVAWGDTDKDGDLDLIGGSYDAALLDAYGQEFLLEGRGGVYHYENDDGVFRPTRLAIEAQALAIILTDINDDSFFDIVVGNDFAVPDYFYLRVGEGRWQISSFFQTMTHSTMSYDVADLNNDGTNELFSTDMKPYNDDEATLSAWQPIMETMHNVARNPAEPQVMENVLLMQKTPDESFGNYAADMAIDASGWSWSGKFGDLDQDGFLDLYIVNGFIEFTMFAHLDNHELVEENQAFWNSQNNDFIVMPEWNLASTASGRGMSMADLDNDGDLDIVVNNLRHPAQLFENQLCSGRSLQVDVIWDNSFNSRAIGTELILQTNSGNFYRHIKSSSGYLSGDTSRIHFGFPSDTIVESLEIHWSDGYVSLIDVPSDNPFITVRRMG